MKRIFALAIAVGLLAGSMGLSTQAGAKSKATVVGKDKAGDWGDGQFPAQLGDALGQDLVEAAIGMADAKTVNFVIKVTSLPSPPGGTPEITRYVWEMSVGGVNQIQLDGKFTNYSRGICDPTAGTCPPPRDPGSAPFFVRTDCTETGGAVSCTEKGLVHAKFDAGAGTITIPVPLKLLGATPGTEITPTTLVFGHVAAMPSTFGSYTFFPRDQLFVSKTFIVPGA